MDIQPENREYNRIPPRRNGLSIVLAALILGIAGIIIAAIVTAGRILPSNALFQSDPEEVTLEISSTPLGQEQEAETPVSYVSKIDANFKNTFPYVRYPGVVDEILLREPTLVGRFTEHVIGCGTNCFGGAYLIDHTNGKIYESLGGQEVRQSAKADVVTVTSYPEFGGSATDWMAIVPGTKVDEIDYRFDVSSYSFIPSSARTCTLGEAGILKECASKNLASLSTIKLQEVSN